MKDKYFDKYDRLGAYHWDAYEQDAEYREHVDHVCGWIQERSILDVGAGDGLITFKLAKGRERVFGIDNNETAVKLSDEKGIFVGKASVYDIGADGWDVEAVYLGDVLEHLSDPEKALRRIHAVLPEGGTLYVVVPAVRDSHADTQYNATSLSKLVTSCGFEVKDKPYTIASRLYASFIKLGVAGSNPAGVAETIGTRPKARGLAGLPKKK